MFVTNHGTSAVASKRPPPKGNLVTILGSSLEVILHELLYTRSLYPRDAFESTRYLGITCHACRHPAVVDYIFETLSIALPALCSGVADELILVFYDSESEDDAVSVEDIVHPSRNKKRVHDKVLEKYVFSFNVESIVDASDIFRKDEDTLHKLGAKKESARDGIPVTISQRIQDLERSMRDVLLKIISLDGTDVGRKRGQTTFSGSTTFKICLHVSNPDVFQSQPHAQHTDGDTLAAHLARCEELASMIEVGKWMCAESGSCEIYAHNADSASGDDCQIVGAKVRPIRSVHVPSCGLKMQLLMEAKI